MEEPKIRVLKSSEIECRVGTANDKGVSLLLYKNARVDMAILDEVFGASRWKRSHHEINGNLYCEVSVRFGEDWVSKEDVGVESYTEKEKGQASDAFKRACVNWGIGRELYSAPFIWINLNDAEWTSRNGKKYPKVTFSVSKIEYDEDRNISLLKIVDKSGAVRFDFISAERAKIKEDEYKKEIGAAKKEIEAAKTKDEMRTLVSKKYSHLKNNKDFMDFCIEMSKHKQDAK